MKKIFISALLLAIVSCQKNISKETTHKSNLDSLVREVVKKQEIDSFEIGEKQQNIEKIAIFKNESKLKKLSERNFNFIIDKLLEDGFGLTHYEYIDYDKIDSGEQETELNTGPVDKRDERVKDKNFFVFEFNYGTHPSLREECFLLQNNIMRHIDFKLDPINSKKIDLLVKKMGGEYCYLDTRKGYQIYKDNQNNYELTFGPEYSIYNDNPKSFSITYKTKDFKTIIANSIRIFDYEKNKFVKLK